MSNTQFGDPYSERNRVPNIAKFEAERQANEPPADAQKPGVDVPKSGKEEKDAIMKRSQGQQAKPTDEVEEQRKKGPRMVKDPVTGQMVLVKDAKLEQYQSGKLNHLDPNDPKGGPATQAAGTNADSASQPAPDPAHPGNVLIHTFPPASDVSLGPFMAQLDRLMYAIIGGSTLLWFFTAFGHGWKHFFWTSFYISTFAGAATTLASLAQRGVEKEVERVRANMHRERGQKYSPPTPESVEWLNAFLQTVWGLINPDMFVPVADTVEDVMQQSLPGFIDAVRISDIGQGTNPLRIVSMRALPDKPSDKEYPRDEWINQGMPPGDDVSSKQVSKETEKRELNGGSDGPDMDQTGDYVNYEVAVSYAALPGQGRKLRSKNIHLLLEFFLGAFDWLHIPVPIWVQVEGIAATVRLRIQFIPEPPYVRNLTFTLMGVPAVEVSVVPLTTRLPNLLDLPFISKFVKMAIAAGTASLIAPKSMTLNIQEMLSNAVIGDTQALGVFVITIHHAEGLSAQDRNGKSDPYIVLAYAKFGKPLYSTRIILGDLNPVFEETAMMLVTRNEVQAEEDLSAMLWDSDKRTADDLIGRVQIPVKKLMAEPNVIHERVDPLMGFEDANEMDGKLYWSIGYFEKAPLNKELERPVPPPKDSQGNVQTEQKPPRTAPEMEMRPGDKAPNPASHDLPPPPPDVQRTPPDPKWPSGILSVVVHQINNLERQNLKGNTGDREGQAGQDTDEPSEEGSNLPSAYCEIIVNDDLVYKTRVKQYSSMPFFEAGTEVFVRNWTTAVVRVVVRDSRLRERDPILGIVNLPLADILTEGSEVTRLYSIQEGVGFGRANISLLFKSVKLELPRAALGWDTATVEISKPLALTIKDKSKAAWITKGTNMVVSTTDSTDQLSKSEATFDSASGSLSWKFDVLRLPVYTRYASSVYFEFGTGGLLNRKPDAIAVLWLNDIVDDEETTVDVPVVVGKDLAQLRQNFLNDFTKKTHEYEVIGTLKVQLRVDAGLDMDHEKNAKSQVRRHAFEAYDHIEGEAQVAEKLAHAGDDGVIDKQERKEIKAANQRQLENRQRGVAGYKPYRTMKWIKQGIKSRIHPDKPAKREPTVNSEA
ncbi:hypothetical protein FRB90_007187 [Tulasnella sp. 427]|nr:hypothetical protein FRB90_007187 [Tulasnella sp. 427]